VVKTNIPVTSSLWKDTNRSISAGFVWLASSSLSLQDENAIKTSALRQIRNAFFIFVNSNILVQNYSKKFILPKNYNYFPICTSDKEGRAPSLSD
jgi:uncharacterized membrane protein